MLPQLLKPPGSAGAWRASLESHRSQQSPRAERSCACVRCRARHGSAVHGGPTAHGAQAHDSFGVQGFGFRPALGGYHRHRALQLGEGDEGRCTGTHEHDATVRIDAAAPGPRTRPPAPPPPPALWTTVAPRRPLTFKSTSAERPRRRSARLISEGDE